MLWIPVVAGVAGVGYLLRSRAKEEATTPAKSNLQQLASLGYAVPATASVKTQAQIDAEYRAVLQAQIDAENKAIRDRFAAADALALPDVEKSIADMRAFAVDAMANQKTAEESKAIADKVKADLESRQASVIQLIKEQDAIKARLAANENFSAYIPLPDDTADGIANRFGVPRITIDIYNPNRSIENFNNSNLTASVAEIIPGKKVYLPRIGLINRSIAMPGAMNPHTSSVSIEKMVEKQAYARQYPPPSSRYYTPAIGDKPIEIAQRLSICPEGTGCPSDVISVIANLNPTQTSEVPNFLGSGRSIWVWNCYPAVPVQIPDSAVDKGQRSLAMGIVTRTVDEAMAKYKLLTSKPVETPTDDNDIALSYGDRLKSGQSLITGQFLISLNGQWLFAIPSLGAPTIYNVEGEPSYTQDNAGGNGPFSQEFANGAKAQGWHITRLSMQPDGNVVAVNAKNEILWALHTHNGGENYGFHKPQGPGNYLVIADDGNLVVYNKDNAAVWDKKSTGGHGGFLNDVAWAFESTGKSIAKVTIDLTTSSVWKVVAGAAVFIPGIGVAVSAGMAAAAVVGKIARNASEILEIAAQELEVAGKAGFDAAIGLLGQNPSAESILKIRMQFQGDLNAQAGFDKALALAKKMGTI